MRRLFPLLAFVMSLSAVTALAESPAPSLYDSASIGLAINGGNGDFSTGATVTSPWLLESRLAVQATVYQSWYMHGFDEEKGEEEWVPFTSYKLGLMGGSMTAGGFMRMYGSGGLLYIVPNKKFSEEKHVSGSYGAFGFEFLSGRGLNYYIELGATGISANADKMPGKPVYASGFFSTVGFRYYL